MFCTSVKVIANMYQETVKFIFLITINSVFLSTSSQSSSSSSLCPQLCTCLKFPVVSMLCEGNSSYRMIHIPTPLLSDVAQLVLDDNNIPTIRQAAFSNTNSVVHLSLKNNSIQEIEGGAFEALTKLQFLYLSKNHIHGIKKLMFTGLTALKVLDLNKNMIRAIQCGSLNHTANLRHMKLAQNKLGLISDCIFKGLLELEMLDISNNHIRAIMQGAFDGLQNLQDLRINNNFLSRLNSHWFTNKYFAHVQLSNNPWKCDCTMMSKFAEAMQGTTGIKPLRNSIYLTCYFPINLKFLIISEMDAKYWSRYCTEKVIFQGYDSTNKTNLFDKESVRSIRSAQEMSGDTTTSSNSNNRLLCDSGTCYAQPNEISISTFQNSGIPADVTTIFLHSNTLQNITATDFVGWYKLKRLVLSYNKISYIENFSFKDQSNLEFIGMNGNRITSINQNTFFGLIGLISFNLRNNAINGAIKTGTFQYMVSLTSMDLAFNQITELEACIFCNATTLKLLSLNNNRITTIHRDAFQGLLSLESIDISNNAIKTFDFTALSNKPYLVDLKTYNNDWSCTCDLYQQYSSFIKAKNLRTSCSIPQKICINCRTPKALKRQSILAADFSDCANPTTITTTTTYTITTKQMIKRIVQSMVPESSTTNIATFQETAMTTINNILVPDTVALPKIILHKSTQLPLPINATETKPLKHLSQSTLRGNSSTTYTRLKESVTTSIKSRDDVPQTTLSKGALQTPLQENEIETTKVLKSVLQTTLPINVSSTKLGTSMQQATTTEMLMFSTNFNITQGNTIITQTLQNVWPAIFIPIAVLILAAVLIYIKYNKSKKQSKEATRHNNTMYSAGATSKQAGTSTKQLQNGFKETKDIQLSEFN